MSENLFGFETIINRFFFFFCEFMILLYKCIPMDKFLYLRQKVQLTWIYKKTIEIQATTKLWCNEILNFMLFKIHNIIALQLEKQKKKKINDL